MGRSTGKSHKERGQQAVQDKQVTRCDRGRFTDELMFATWWWKVITDSWRVEMAYTKESVCTVDVLKARSAARGGLAWWRCV